MKKTTFKVLLFAGQYVDESRLQRGIYLKSVPVLHGEDETIDSMKKTISEYGNIISGYDVNAAIENLDKCVLTAVELITIS